MKHISITQVVCAHTQKNTVTTDVQLALFGYWPGSPGSQGGRVVMS